MDLSFSPAEARFREEVRDWLADNTPRDKPPVHSAELRDFELAWQKRQWDGGWAGIAWPRAYGGRGLSVVEQLIWFEEYAAAGESQPESGGVEHLGPGSIARRPIAESQFMLKGG